MDFESGRRKVNPKVYSTGTSHARWSLLMRPLKWTLVMLPLAIGSNLIASQQDDHVAYFAFTGFLTTSLLLVWLVETITVLPVVLKWRHVVKQMPIRHNPLLDVSCSVYNTSIAIPAFARAVVVRLVQIISGFMFLLGGMTVSASPDSQLTVEAVLAFATFLYFLTFANWISGYLRRYIMSRECAVRGTGRGVVRVMQFNIHAGVGVDGRFDPRRTADAIRNSGADIVALQEVPRHCKVNQEGVELGAQREAVDLVEQLSTLCGLDVVFCSKTIGYGGQFGNAILSRWPAQEVSQLRLMGWKHHGSNMLFGPVPQIALAGRFRPPGFVNDLWVASTQFGLDASGQEQVEEMRELVHWCRHSLRRPGSNDTAAENKGKPESSAAAPSRPPSSASASSSSASSSRRSSSSTSAPLSTANMCCGTLPELVPKNVVVCGDFSATSSSPVMAFARQCGLQDARTLVPPHMFGPQETYPAKHWQAVASPDKILVSSNPCVRVLDCKPLPISASTHRPVLAVLADISPQ